MFMIFLVVAVFGIELGIVITHLAYTLNVEMTYFHLLLMALVFTIAYVYAGIQYVLHTKSKAFANWITHGYKPTIVSYLVIILWPIYGIIFACKDLHHALISRNYNKDL